MAVAYSGGAGALPRRLRVGRTYALTAYTLRYLNYSGADSGNLIREVNFSSPLVYISERSQPQPSSEANANVLGNRVHMFAYFS